MKPIIEVAELSKVYEIGHDRHPIWESTDRKNRRITMRALGALTRTRRTTEEVWALKDVSFEVERGDTLAIIGRNGSGKSTLLKVLSRIVRPTSGRAILRGRSASLLEVGTGFHPELTGRENVFLNGALLGMRRVELQRKFDEIVEFSGVERFLDTPVKFYSSGMAVRLAFAVAAHLEPEILIVDEVLAVGDTQFQEKSIGKMRSVASEGRTVLFVSHNVAAVQMLCEHAIHLDAGQLQTMGRTAEVVDAYRRSLELVANVGLADRADRRGNGKLRVTQVRFTTPDGRELNELASGEDVDVLLDYELHDPSVAEIRVALGIDAFATQHRIAHIDSAVLRKTVATSTSQIRISIRRLPLNVGRYQLTVWVDQLGEALDWIQAAKIFEVGAGDFYGTGKMPEQDQGSLLLDYDFRG